MSTVSVIIPVYNVENYLKRCVYSVINQTFKDLEIILVDDGSTDSSGKICDEFKFIDERIVVIHKKNGGLSSARNVGIRMSTSEYITFIDSDDFVTSDYIDYVYGLLKKYDVDVVSVDYIRTSNEKILKNREDKITIFSDNDSVTNYLKCGCRRKNNFPAWNKIYKRNLFSDISFPEGKIYEDMNTNLLVFMKTQKTINSTKMCYSYWINPKSITQNNFTKKNFDLLIASGNILNTVKKENNSEMLKYANAINAKAYFSLLVKIFKDKEFINYNKNEVKDLLKKFKSNFKYLFINEIPLSIKFVSAIFYLFYDFYIS